MRPVIVVLATVLSLAACARATLPYTPAQQSVGARISAAYQVVAERVRIEVDSDRRRLEEATIVKADGTELRPQAIENAPPRTSGGYPVSVGVGGSTWGGRGGIGTGVSVGVPVGGGSTPGNTFLWFARDQVGLPPWSLHLKVAGVEPVVIVVGGADRAP